ncbi:MAG: PAS domain-containing sensor histidine kinase [bacterium]
MDKKPKVFEELERLAELSPAAFYWTDTNAVIIGVNERGLKIVGDLTYKDIVGKSPYDMYPPEIAKIVESNTKKVIETGETLIFEEYVDDLKTGKRRYYKAIRSPLVDDGKIVGTVGTPIEITDTKEKERLEVENEADKKVVKILKEMAHDVRSPALAMCSIVDDYAAVIPEGARVSLKSTAMNIVDVANSFIGTKEGDVSAAEEKKPIIACLNLMQVLGEKRYQHKGSAINFTEDYSQDSKLVFIKAQPSHFRRMISNLLNNAIEALEGKKGTIHLGLSTDEMKKDPIVTIQDTGKGMPEEVIKKIKSGVHVATDKKEGHGIGLGQIQEAIKNNWGKLDIVSVLGEGTKMIITFPIEVSPEWLAKSIKLNKDDLVLILDDDPSIHVNWDTYFKKHTTDVQLKHFTSGKETIDFINAFPNKNKLYLLTDYELIKQNITGMDIVKQTGIERATLVTSHYAEIEVQKLAAEHGAKILPKDLAMEVAIEICDNEKCIITSVARKVGFIIVDDNEILASHIVKSAESKNIIADKYCNPDNYLKNIHKYDKDVIMLIDHEFKGNELSGFDVLKKLHELGFTKLYLFSGMPFDKSEIPDYVTVVMKSDMDALTKLIDGTVDKSKLSEKTDEPPKVTKSTQVENKTQVAKNFEKEAFMASLGKLTHDANNLLGIIHMTLSAIKSNVPEEKHAQLANSAHSISEIIKQISNGYIKNKVLSEQLATEKATIIDTSSIKEEQPKAAVINAKVVKNTQVEKAITEDLKDLIHKANNSTGLMSMILGNIESDISKQDHDGLVDAVKSIKNIINILSDGYKKDQTLLKHPVAETTTTIDASKVNAVVVDNTKPLADIVASTFRKKNKTADVYYDPHTFLQNVSKYDQNTIIVMDYDLEDEKLNGLDVLKQLHDRGFTKLYLFSGSEIEKGTIPEYVTFIPKSNTDAITALASS